MIGPEEGAAPSAPAGKRNAVALLKEADACLEILHLRPVECRPITLSQVPAVRELLVRIAGRVAEMRADLFGDSGED